MADRPVPKAPSGPIGASQARGAGGRRLPSAIHGTRSRILASQALGTRHPRGPTRRLAPSTQLGSKICKKTRALCFPGAGRARRCPLPAGLGWGQPDGGWNEPDPAGGVRSGPVRPGLAWPGWERVKLRESN